MSTINRFTIKKKKKKTMFISLFISHDFEKGSQEKLFSMRTPFTLHPLSMIFVSGLIKTWILPLK